MITRGKIGFAVMALLYLLWNFVAAFSNGMQDSWDTSRYFGGVFDIQNPGFTTTLLFTTLKEPTSIMVALLALSTFAWLALAWVIFQRLDYSPMRWPLIVILLLISMSTPIWSWHTVLLSESLTQTSVVMWLATVVWLMGGKQARASFNIRMVVSTLAAGFIIITRPQLLIVVIPAQFIFLLWESRRSGTWKFTGIGVGILTLFGTLGGYRLMQLSSEDYYQYGYSMNNFVDKTPSFRAYALESMPTCQPLVDALNGPAPWPDILAMRENLIAICPETWFWFNTDAARFSSWVLEIPAVSWSNFMAVIPALVFLAMTSGMAMPEWLSNIVLAPDQLWLWSGIYAVIGVVIALLVQRSLRVSLWGLISAMLLALSGVLYLFVIWGSDGYDLSRHIYPYVPFIGIALLALIPTVSQRRVAAEKSVPIT